MIGSTNLRVDEGYVASPYQSSKGGFEFDLTDRNKSIMMGKSKALPKATKTGTTICGVVCKDCIVLGADTRATSELIVDKNCQKIDQKFSIKNFVDQKFCRPIFFIFFSDKTFFDNFFRRKYFFIFFFSKHID